MKNLIPVVCGVVALTLSMSAQSSRRPMGTVLVGDDDVKVEVWRGGGARAPEIAGAAALRRPLLQVMFVGGGWEPSVKAAILGDLWSASMPEGVSPASIVGGAELPAPDTVNDLGIQAILDRAMSDGSLGARDPNTIQIVVLGPTVRSTLGAFKPHVDYDSYHSHFHTGDAKVRYVVVPWNDHLDAMRQATVGGTLLAVLNPDGA
jgi:hypothetical protein